MLAARGAGHPRPRRRPRSRWSTSTYRRRVELLRHHCRAEGAAMHGESCPTPESPLALWLISCANKFDSAKRPVLGDANHAAADSFSRPRRATARAAAGPANPIFWEADLSLAARGRFVAGGANIRLPAQAESAVAPAPTRAALLGAVPASALATQGTSGAAGLPCSQGKEKSCSKSVTLLCEGARRGRRPCAWPGMSPAPRRTPAASRSSRTR
jgi:hypothetical protein